MLTSIAWSVETASPSPPRTHRIDVLGSPDSSHESGECIVCLSPVFGKDGAAGTLRARARVSSPGHSPLYPYPLSIRFFRRNGCGCNYAMHPKCMEDWLATRMVCPVCRRSDADADADADTDADSARASRSGHADDRVDENGCTCHTCEKVVGVVFLGWLTYHFLATVVSLRVSGT